jgi:hypothetical protein
MSRRCTYCLLTKPDPSFRTVEHVMPAALGGEWKTRRVCDACQERANQIALSSCGPRTKSETAITASLRPPGSR